jgi:transcriptional regulator with XRE-family HTH domain
MNRPLTAGRNSVSFQGVSDWQERLVEAMGARGISGGELGRRAGFSAQYINSLRSKERGARLPLDTARRLAAALGVSVEWLTAGTGPRERLSDVYPIYVDGGSPDSATPPSASPPADRYPGRAEAIALLSTTVEPEVIAALRAKVPDDPDTDPGRERWIVYARELATDLRRIKSDPLLNPGSDGVALATSGAPPGQTRLPSPTRKKAK